MHWSVRRHRHGVAAVEFAFIAPVVTLILVGLWEAGRMIQLQQVLSNSAREGARVAAQSITINTTGAPTHIHATTGTPNVKQTAVNSLREAAVTLPADQVTVTFAFITGDTSKTEPYQGVKGQQFRVTVTIPVSELRWTSLGLVQPSTLT